MVTETDLPPTPPNDGNRNRPPSSTSSSRTQGTAVRASSNTSNTICRNFAQGSCWYGDRCRFSHNITTRASTSYNPNMNIGNTTRWNVRPVPPSALNPNMGFGQLLQAYTQLYESHQRLLGQLGHSTQVRYSTGQQIRAHVDNQETKLPHAFNNLTLQGESKMKKKDSKYSCVLESGMVLLKNYISITDQVEIVQICQEFGKGRGGFYKPSALNFELMCFGRNWDPKTYYTARCRDDGSEAPPIPDKLLSLAEAALKESQAYDKTIPSMDPDICIVNSYATSSQLRLHKDDTESADSVDKGLPVVSFSIGDTATFLYSRYKDEKIADKVDLQSGDVLIFGGKSRKIFHGVDRIISNSAPPLIKESMLKPGRLNLTFRKY